MDCSCWVLDDSAVLMRSQMNLTLPMSERLYWMQLWICLSLMSKAEEGEQMSIPTMTISVWLTLREQCELRREGGQMLVEMPGFCNLSQTSLPRYLNENAAFCDWQSSPQSCLMMVRKDCAVLQLEKQMRLSWRKELRICLQKGMSLRSSRCGKQRLQKSVTGRRKQRCARLEAVKRRRQSWTRSMSCFWSQRSMSCWMTCWKRWLMSLKESYISLVYVSDESCFIETSLFMMGQKIFAQNSLLKQLRSCSSMKMGIWPWVRHKYSRSWFCCCWLRDLMGLYSSSKMSGIPYHLFWQHTSERTLVMWRLKVYSKTLEEKLASAWSWITVGRQNEQIIRQSSSWMEMMLSSLISYRISFSVAFCRFSWFILFCCTCCFCQSNWQYWFWVLVLRTRGLSGSSSLSGRSVKLSWLRPSMLSLLLLENWSQGLNSWLSLCLRYSLRVFSSMQLPSTLVLLSTTSLPSQLFHSALRVTLLYLPRYLRFCWSCSQWTWSPRTRMNLNSSLVSTMVELSPLTLEDHEGVLVGPVGVVALELEAARGLPLAQLLEVADHQHAARLLLGAQLEGDVAVHVYKYDIIQLTHHCFSSVTRILLRLSASTCSRQSTSRYPSAQSFFRPTQLSLLTGSRNTSRPPLRRTRLPSSSIFWQMDFRDSSFPSWLPIDALIPYGGSVTIASKNPSHLHASELMSIATYSGIAILYYLKLWFTQGRSLASSSLQQELCLLSCPMQYPWMRQLSSSLPKHTAPKWEQAIRLLPVPAKGSSTRSPGLTRAWLAIKKDSSCARVTGPRYTRSVSWKSFTKVLSLLRSLPPTCTPRQQCCSFAFSPYSPFFPGLWYVSYAQMQYVTPAFFRSTLFFISTMSVNASIIATFSFCSNHFPQDVRNSIRAVNSPSFMQGFSTTFSASSSRLDPSDKNTISWFTYTALDSSSSNTSVFGRQITINGQYLNVDGWYCQLSS